LEKNSVVSVVCEEKGVKPEQRWIIFKNPDPSAIQAGFTIDHRLTPVLPSNAAAGTGDGKISGSIPDEIAFKMEAK
jgi:hypothetical protein